VSTIGRAHGGHEILLQKWADNGVSNDFNAVICNCVLWGLINKWSGESQDVLCIQEAGGFVELSKCVSSEDQMENRMVKFSWMRKSEDMMLDVDSICK